MAFKASFDSNPHFVHAKVLINLQNHAALLDWFRDVHGMRVGRGEMAGTAR
jgi:hypothetical protein